MQDRLKFRAGLTVPYYKDNGDDAEILLIFDGFFSVDSGGVGITIHEDVITDSLYGLDLSDKEIQSIYNYLETNFCSIDDYYFIDNLDFLEQCTGLKDKNGKLIYEGDWLKTKDGYYCYVVWFEGFWWVKSLPSEAMDFEHSEFYGECEVVGNINENPDLMEVKE